MPSPSPSSSAQAARQRLGEQLRNMRQAAGISGVRFAVLAGWKDATNVSKLERGRRTITAEHVQLWCRICRTPEQRAEELLAEQRAVARMWISYRDKTHQVGLNTTQRLLVGDIYDTLSLEQVYQTKLIPGLLQTEAYMTGVLTDVRRERGLTVDDVAEAVTERLSRQRNLRRADARFMFIIEEPVLHQRPFGTDVQRDQLQHLLEAVRLPSVVSLAVIPVGIDRRGFRPRESFDITDNSLVTIELISGYLSLTHPEELLTYRRAWADLSSLAVIGKHARALIRAARESLADGQEDW